jgi:amino acid adenylation domain-containing protein
MTPAHVDIAIARHARTAPDRPAVKDLDRHLSYAALDDEVADLAAGLVDSGVMPGGRVALHLPNSVDFVVAALACLRIGAVFVPLAPSDPTARIDAILADCTPVLVITGDVTEGAVAAEAVPAPRRRGSTPWVRYAELLHLRGATRPFPDESSDRSTYAIYTSGTTGTPKGVLIGNRAFAAAVHSTIDALGLDAGTRALCVSPFHFDGSFGTLFATLVAGGSLVLRPRESLLYPRTFFNAVLEEEITYTGFSPTYLKLLLASRQIGSLKDGTLDIVALGGEASSASDIRALWEVAPQLRVFNRYGPTETTIAVTHVELTPELLAEGTVPIGIPHQGVTFHLVDQDATPVSEEGAVGELYIGGSQLMAGYWGAPELTAAALRDDVVPGQTVYRTGDLVYRDRRGHYVYVDRADRVIKRFGVRISLLELTVAMERLPGVSDAACVVFDNEGETGIAAFVVGDRTLSTIDLRNDARALLPETMLPDRVDLVDELPLTPAGKLDERRLLAGVGLNGRPVGPSLAAPAPR